MKTDAELQGTKARLEIAKTLYREAEQCLSVRDERIRELESLLRAAKGQLALLLTDRTAPYD